MSKILVLGAGGNAGINFSKALNLAGRFEVFGVDSSNYFFQQSIYARCYLSTSNCIEKKIRLINQICADHEIDFIHAQPDQEVDFLTHHGHELEAPCWPLRITELEQFNNKLTCQQIWSGDIGAVLTSSLTDCLQNPETFEKIKSISGKVWVRAIRGAGSRAALPISTLEQAKFWADYWVSNRGLAIEDFMLAEYLPGNEYAVQTLWADGQLVASQARQRVEYFFGSIMPSGQSSTPSVAKTVHCREVYDTAYAAITTIEKRPNGIYCVDIKENQNKKLVPMEVNYGRFFTTSDFFASIGVNMPAMYCDLATNKSTEIPTAIESITDSFYWVRGLDREPNLFKDVSSRTETPQLKPLAIENPGAKKIKSVSQKL